MTIGIFSISPWLILALVLIFLFKKQIIEFIEKHLLKKIEIGNTKLYFDEYQRLKFPTAISKKIGEQPPESLPEILAELKTSIIKRINEKNLENDQEKLQSLFTEYADIQLRFMFECIESRIFGSQIVILQHLANINNDTVEGIKNFYEQARSFAPDLYKNYPFKQYIKFLLHAYVIVVKENRYFITTFGRLYLEYRRLANRIPLKLPY